MRTLLVLFLHLSLSFLLFSVKADSPRWEEELDASVKRNIIGECKVTRNLLPQPQPLPQPLPLQGNGTKPAISPSELLVHIIYPSKAEIRYMRQLPVSLTQANSDLAESAKRWRYTYEAWGKAVNRWQVPSNHPGQDRNNCISMTFLAATERVVSYYEQFRHVRRTFYLVQGKQAFVHPTGAVAFSCGFFRGEEGCENRFNTKVAWFQSCKHHMSKSKHKWHYLFEHNLTALHSILRDCAGSSSIVLNSTLQDFRATRHSKVFTIAALWDFNYHHWIADSLARLARHLPFLLANKDIMIHIRQFEDYLFNIRQEDAIESEMRKMRLKFFDLLGIDRSRIVTGAILADEVYIPRALRCSYLLSNPLELQLLAKHLLTAAYATLGIEKESAMGRPSSFALNNKHSKQKQLRHQTSPHRIGINKPENRTIIIQQRYTNNTSGFRSWNDQTVRPVVKAFAKYFTEHHTVLLSSNDLGNKSLAQEILLYSQADVLVGLHGAGMTNMMFMPPNSLIIEFVGKIVDVNMPVCGYYGPMGAVFGHHHYIHSYDGNQTGVVEMDTRPEEAAERAWHFYQLLHKARKEKDEAIFHVYHSVKEQYL